MTRQLWIADACRATGLRVVEVQGWRDRGSASFSPRGLVIHHTAGAPTGDMPSLDVVVAGRTNLPGPLAQFGLGRSGTVYVVASGRANHAGSGGWRGLSGNTSVWGIEAENTGRGEPWSPAQLDAYHRLAAVLAAHSGFGAEMVCAHREWAPTRKIDPAGIDMPDFRATVARLLQEDDDVLTPDQAATLDAIATEVGKLAVIIRDPSDSIMTDLNAATEELGKLAVVVRDNTSGMSKRLDDLADEVRAIAAKVGA